MKTKMVRQGDVLLLRVPSLPKGATPVEADKGRVVLAYGEVTGHAHAIMEVSKAKLHDFRAERFLQLTERIALRHEEHSAVFLDAGTYKQGFQVEERRAEIQRVAD